MHRRKQWRGPRPARSMLRRIRGLAVCLAMLAVPPLAPAQAAKLVAPNVAEVSDHLVTSGQPSAAALAELKTLGFEAVIYLAPPTVPDAVRDEHLVVARQGLPFINIPVAFDRPTESDFETFASVLAGLGQRKVLVHCQVNFRASSMVFLYRTIKLKEPPLAAYQTLQKTWNPTGPWRQLIESLLRKNGIAFELF